LQYWHAPTKVFEYRPRVEPVQPTLLTQAAKLAQIIRDASSTGEPLPHDTAQDGSVKHNAFAAPLCWYSMGMAIMEEAAVVGDSFSVTPLSAHTGAEVVGVDLSSPVDEQTRNLLNQAFLDHSVIAIPDQTLDAAQFLEAMKIFGDIFLQHNPRFAVTDCPQIHYISNQDRLEDGRLYIRGEGYHTDHSNDIEPPKATALCAVKLPTRGGDTQFVNMCESYDALPEEMKRRIERLRARHVYQSKYSERKLRA
jgi:hypothetical protein